MAAEDKDPERDPERDEDRGGDDTRPAAPGTDPGGAGRDDADGRDRPGQTEPPFSIAFGDGTARVDRDDDSGADDTTSQNRDNDSASSAFYVDSDYMEDFPELSDARHGDSTGQNDKPDPGFAAFPDEFDDPLADWPAPNTDLDSLPEMRERAATGADAEGPTRDRPFADGSLAGDGADGTGPGNPDASTPGLLADEFPDVAFFDDPVEPDASDNDADTPPRESPYGSAIVDSDEPAPGSEDMFFEKVEADNALDDLPAARDIPLPAVTELPDPPDIEDVGEDAYGDIDDLASLADDGSGGKRDDSDLGDDADDDAFIDDFLNDLDEPDDAGLREDPVERDRDFTVAPADGPDASLAPPQRGGSGSAAVAQYGAGILDANDGRADAPAMDGKGGEGVTAGSDDGDPRLPWGMIAVVAVALLLLAAGGFGVVQQRSSLKAEIRDLQAQLATAVAPQEAAAERQRLRQIELENESLAAELAALEAENSALSEQLASLEIRLEEQLAAQEGAALEAEASAAAALSAAQSTEPARAGNAFTPAADDSGWFVNFGSYAQDQVARRWADRLDVSNGRVVVQEARAAGRTLYRVRVVSLPTQDAAERVAAALEREHQLPRLWVGRY